MSKPNIYVLNGSGGCGKDTFVDLFNEVCDKTVWHISTITPIKNAAKILGWNEEKNEVTRKFLSDLKDLCTEAFDTSFKYIEEKIDEAIDDEIEYVFIDCREPKEIERICNTFNAKSIYIDASKRVPIITSNHADNNVKQYNYDLYINNNGSIKQLKDKAKMLWKGELG